MYDRGLWRPLVPTTNIKVGVSQSVSTINVATATKQKYPYLKTRDQVHANCKLAQPSANVVLQHVPWILDSMHTATQMTSTTRACTGESPANFFGWKMHGADVRVHASLLGPAAAMVGGAPFGKRWGYWGC